MTGYPINHHVGASFTVELGCLVENGFDLGMNSYPIFDDAYREQLNNKIIEHFWFREIGQETPQLFKMLLNRTMNEIMPYYNELYKSTLLDYNPLANVDVATTGNRDIARAEDRTTDRKDTYATNRSESAQSSSGSNTTSTGRTVNSMTPQMQLAGNEDYASSLVDVSSNADTNGTTQSSASSGDSGQTDVNELAKMNASDTENYVNHVAGLQGITAANAIMQMRDAIINVDMMVIYALEPLFMQVWNTGMGLY